MSNIAVEIDDVTCKISSKWTVSELSNFWKKEKKYDPEVRILCWKQQVIQGIVKKVDIPTEGSLASHGVKEGSKYVSHGRKTISAPRVSIIANPRINL
jgi:hypothetical protein